MDASAVSSHFRAVLAPPHAKKFKEILAVLANLVEIVELRWDSTGVSASMLDSAHVFFIELHLEADEFFSQYEGFKDQSDIVSPDVGDISALDTTDNEGTPVAPARRHAAPPEEVRTSLNIDLVKRCLKDVDKNAMLEIEPSADGDYLSVIVSHPNSYPKRTTSFMLPQLIVGNNADLAIPDQVYPAEFTLPPPALSEICQALKGSDQEIQIKVDPEGIVFRVTAPCTAEARLEKQESVPILCREPCEPKFKFAYFEKISQAAKVQGCDEVLLQLGNDIPLSMCYTFASGSKSAFNFFLAPMQE